MNTDVAVAVELQKIAKFLDEILKGTAGERIGFCLLAFSPVDGQRVNYVSNCDRQLVTKALQELFKRWDEGMPDIPAQEIN